MSDLFDIRQLQNFVALVEEGSFTKAAKRVNLSQSAISHSLKNLETEIGSPLVKRAGQNLLLTEHGEVFLGEAKDILDRMRTLRERLVALNDWGRGRLRIGAGATACQYFLPAVLRELRDTFPYCDLNIRPGDTPQNLEDLRAGKVDVALLVRGGDFDRIQFQRLFVDELRVVIPRGHAWARQARLRSADFESQTVLQYGSGTVTHGLVAEYFEEQGVRVSQSIELSSMDALREMARIGQGVALLPDWGMERGEAQGLVSRPLPGRPVRREWGLASLKGKPLSLLESIFQGLCEEHAFSFSGRNMQLYPATKAIA